MRKVLLTAALMIALTSCANANTNTETKEDNKQTEQNMTTIHLTKEQFLEKVVNFETNPNEWKYLGDKPAIIDFYATWCGPCKMLSPVLEELAAEYGDKLVIYKIDTDQEKELASVFGIRSVPTLLFVPMEGDPRMAMGALGKADLKKAIEEVLSVK